MINVKLQDGRVLTFDQAARSGGDSGFGDLREAHVVGIRSDGFRDSTALKRGPDFLLRDPDKPDETIAVEIKVGLKKSSLNRRAFQQWQPRLAQYHKDLLVSQGRDIPLQLWLLNRDARELRIWTVNEKGEPHDERQYRLAQVSSQSPEATDAMIVGNSGLTTQELVRRVDDWESRVRGLFATVREWCHALGPDVVANEIGSVTMNEELMQRFAVPARELPALAVRRADQDVLTFRPYGLWVIGANGRIDVFGQAASYFLVDRAPRFQPADWQLYGGGGRRIVGRRIADGVDFTKEAFEDLLRG